MLRKFALLISIGLAGSPLKAQPMPALAVEERQNWHAVGRLYQPLGTSRSACTGTLIAPSVVLTAAHCAQAKVFAAGWDHGDSIASRDIVAREIHPRYQPDAGLEGARYDLALLRLSDPIPVDLVRPISLHKGALPEGEPFKILGYHQARPNLLNGRNDCDAIGPAERGLFLDCQVIAGNSGGPVLGYFGDEVRIVAVISSRISGLQELAFAARLDMWLHDAK